MKAKTLKEAIANIPDDANVIFEHSGMLFGQQFDEVLVTSGEDEIKSFAKAELFYDTEEAFDLAKSTDHIIHFSLWIRN